MARTLEKWERDEIAFGIFLLVVSAAIVVAGIWGLVYLVAKVVT